MLTPLTDASVEKRHLAELGLAFDGVWHEWHAEVHWHIKSIRDVRANLLSLAYLASKDPTVQVILALPGCRISGERLQAERDMMNYAFSEHVANRVHLAWQFEEGPLQGVPTALPQKGRTWLQELIDHEGARPSSPHPQATKHLVLGWLLLSWLQGTGFQTTQALCESVGASYPTTAGVIKRLEASHLIVRGPGRSVALNQFPHDEWRRWLVAGQTARKTFYFKDQSGQPRMVYELLERFFSLKKSNMAVGGVIGATHHYPKLDITAAPRLDLTMHIERDASLDFKFIRRLDAALKECAPDPSANLVVHLLSRRQSCFVIEENGRLWADPIECLADLHEMRLDAQADEMLHALLLQRVAPQGRVNG